MKKILVVEDQRIVARDIQCKLEGLGYNVPVIVSRGEEVLEVAKEIRPDLVLMDIRLEGKMDGIEAAVQLRRALDIPTVYITAYADDDTLKRATISEPFGYLLKPFEERDLAITIEIALYKHGIEKKLKESELWLSTTLNSIGDAVIATDTKGYINFMNPVAESLTGWKKEDAVYKHLTEILNITDEKTNKPIKDFVEEVLREGTVLKSIDNTILTAKDGTKISVADSAAPIGDEQGNFFGTVFVIKDVTVQKRAEAALQVSEERLRSLYENAAIGLYRTKPDGQILMANPTLVRMLGYSSFEELVQRNLENEGFLPESPRNEFKRIIEEMGEVKNVETVWRRKDGKPVYIRESAKAFKNTDGEILYYIGTVSDITELKYAEAERKKLEAKILQAQKLESLGVLAGGLAHDFNNLLQGILGNASLALLDLEPESPVHESIEQIEKSGQRAADLTKQMLAYSGKGRFVVNAINLSKLIIEMKELLESSVSKKADLKVSLKSDLPNVEADASQIRQVILNLVTNASEALGEKNGDIRISTGVMECDRTFLENTYMDDDLLEGIYVYIEVSDTGSGMDEKTMRKLFDPFFSTKFVGRGLGLAAVLGIVRGHQGAIKVMSEPGEGSTFIVLFPTDGKFFKKSEINQGSLSFHKSSDCILVVDDEEQVLSLTERILRRNGYNVLTASDGQKAIKTFREHPDEISAVLLDLTMPGMDGEEIFSEIRKIREDACVILSSGYDEHEVFRHFKGKGLAGFIQKPYHPESLLNKLKEVIPQR